jgi:hypothetical protein
MKSKSELKAVFSIALRDGLVLRYKSLPSAAFLAREFNLRIEDLEPISQESARRWIRGLAIPEFDKLLVLRSWLDLDLNAIGMPSIESIEAKDIQYKKELLDDQNDYVKTAQSIKLSLKKLMEEVEILEIKLTAKN